MFYKRLFKPPKEQSFFLFGPRGTGKTTYLKQNYSNALIINLLDSSEETLFSMHPSLLKERIDSQKEKPAIVIIDEVQKVPKILDMVHLLIEEGVGIQFILTGSSSRKLKRGGVNLLAGRALWKNFHPFIAYEVKERFNLATALKTGMIPLIFNSKHPEETLRSYIHLYLQEEVKAEALVRQIGEFARFLEAMAFSHASLVNCANISRECLVNQKTVSLHLQVLEDLLLGYTLPVFEKRAKREITSHPKFYFFDPGVFRALRRQGFLDLSTESEGAALEGLVAEHLRCWIDFQIERNDLYFWRTRSGLEVDFILYGPNVFYAIEVKNNHTISPHDLRGLKEFRKDYPEATMLLLYRGKQRLKREGILCLPAEDFLKELNPLEPFLPM